VQRTSGIDPTAAYVISRFTYLRRDNDKMVLESPVVPARILCHDWQVGALVCALGVPRRVGELSLIIPGISENEILMILEILIAAEMVLLVDRSHQTLEDGKPSLRAWDFHDLVFHTRSREGRHDYPYGGTYRFFDEIEAPPPLEVREGGNVIPLFRPDLAELERADPPFARLQELRRSVRAYGYPPVSLAQLGEFLYRVNRVADYQEVSTTLGRGVVRSTLVGRPYPSGGGLYELELYIAVQNCDGLGPGIYYHDPQSHVLRSISECGRRCDKLLSDAGLAAGIPQEDLQLLIIISARFLRMSWKYSSISYSVILKDVGVLLQTLYLSATAMNLAPCALGGGNSDVFADAVGADYYTESSVGEFLLGSKIGDNRRTTFGSAF
jgi:SagB-type dehydrogenase family enzyme